MTTLSLVLGSSSPARKELLQRLALPFTTHSPDIDESRLPEESVKPFVTRLAKEKAEAVIHNHPNSIVICCDQSAVNLGHDPEEILGKPKTPERAKEMLSQASAQTVVFYSGLHIINTASLESRTACIETHVTYRSLSADEIDRYLQIEDVLNCAGAIKSEGIGVSLFESLIEPEPGTLMGLPLITTAQFMRELGLNPLGV